MATKKTATSKTKAQSKPARPPKTAAAVDLSSLRRPLTRLYYERFSYVQLTGAILSAKPPMWIPAVGWVIEVSIYDSETYKGPNDTLILIPKDGSADLAAVEAKWKASLAALKARGAARRALSKPLSETLGLPKLTYTKQLLSTTPDDDARRRASLDKMMGRFDQVAEHFNRIYGLRLPRHAAVFAAFWDSLSDMERRGMENLGRRPGGVIEYFGDKGLTRATTDGLDARLDCRFRADPPEFVTVMWGDSDGLHYGLWYDDPRDPPSFIASNYARDSAETSTEGKTTALEQLRHEIKEREEDGDDDDDGDTTKTSKWMLAALKGALRAFQDADSEAVKQDGPRPWAKVKRPHILGALCPALPPSSGDPRGTYPQVDERSKAYKAQSKAVQKWLKEARRELAQGKPAFALVLGQELHWFDHDAYRSDSLDLLVSAYEALGRRALAEIAKVHHANRDLASVSVFASTHDDDDADDA